eukprot:jgi/Mesvir1/393/Mv11284-RA.2
MWSLHSDFACEDVTSRLWKRRLCFEPVAPYGPPCPPGDVNCIGELVIRMFVRKQVIPESGQAPPPDQWENGCGDSYRARFTSVNEDTWFASLNVIEGEACGSAYEIVFQPPAHRGKYKMELRLIHVDGEGMLDPSRNLSWSEGILWTETRYQGPTVYNLRLLPHGTLEIEVADFAHSLASHGGINSDHHGLKPQCTSGDHRGRWTLADDLRYPPFEGEPFQWLPYDCRYRMYTTTAIRGCLQRKPNMHVMMVGESILQEMYQITQRHLNGTQLRATEAYANYYWPLSHEDHPEDDPRPFHNQIRFRMRHGLGVINPVMKDLAAQWREGHLHRPSVLVMLCAHNDMMRRSMEEYISNLNELISIIRDDAQHEGRIIWVTAPARLYKVSGSPGECRCPGGKSKDCGPMGEDPHCWCVCNEMGSWTRERVVTGGSFVEPEGWLLQDPEMPSGMSVREERMQPFPTGTGLLSWENPGVWDDRQRRDISRALPLVHNTYPRVKWANRKAVEMLKAAFPGRVDVLDFEALTEALTPDYCIDGIHWGCRHDYLLERVNMPWHCRNLGSATLSNMLVNMLCAGP